MAKLLIKTPGFENSLIELKLGVNRIGRSPDNDFPISHPSVSNLHCELILREDGVLIRDLESTNGTFVNGQQIKEVKLSVGQSVHLGDVELFVESTDVKVAIPKFINTDLPAPPVVLTDGSLVCPRHPQARVTHQCTQCKEVMCEACVHQLRRKRSDTVLFLCPVCSGPVEPLGGLAEPKSKSLSVRLGETVKLKFKRLIHLKEEDHQE
jgi:hypothetical protein